MFPTRSELRMISLLLVFLTLAYGVGAQAPAPPTKTPRQTLFDFRVDDARNPPKIAPATERLVLSKVFKKYLTDESKCSSDFESNNSDPLKGARDAGQMVPSIVDITSGSFTAAGRQETAYVISVSECNASHAENFGSKRIAFFAGPQLIAEMDVDFKQTIVRKTDLNGDGLDELLMESSDMAQGTLTEMAGLLEFRDGQLRVIEDFGTVVEDSCASELPGSTSKASVISINPTGAGQMPRLRIDNYEKTCRKKSRWRFVSTGKMQE